MPASLPTTVSGFGRTASRICTKRALLIRAWIYRDGKLWLEPLKLCAKAVDAPRRQAAPAHCSMIRKQIAICPRSDAQGRTSPGVMPSVSPFWRGQGRRLIAWLWPDGVRDGISRYPDLFE